MAKKKTATNPTHGFAGDPQSVPADAHQTAVQKNAKLELVLGQIANFATIVRNASSLNDIWFKICEHYGFQTNGSCFLGLFQIQLNPEERAEDQINV